MMASLVKKPTRLKAFRDKYAKRASRVVDLHQVTVTRLRCLATLKAEGERERDRQKHTHENTRKFEKRGIRSSLRSPPGHFLPTRDGRRRPRYSSPGAGAGPGLEKYLRNSRLRALSTEKESIASQAKTPGGVGEAQEQTTILLDVTGMRCGGCSANVKKSLLGHPSVSQASVNLLTGTAAVTTDKRDKASESETAQAIAEMIEQKGFKCSVRDGSHSRGTNEGTSSGQGLVAEGESDWADFGGLALSAGFLILCCGHHLGHFFHAAGLHQLAGFFGGHGGGQASLFGNRIVQSVAATAAILGPGREIVVDGFKSLKNGVPNMNTLVGIGTGAALAVGLSQALGLPATSSWEDSSHLLEEPVMLLSVILLGRLLEKRAKKRATRELRALGSLVPQTSRLVFDQKGVTRNMQEDETQSLAVWNDFDTMSIETNDVRPGDIVKVLPGESIPVDGLILAGESALDESLLTGESSLVKKRAGNEVIAGTINYDGSLIVRARCSGTECTVKAMKDFVEAAQARDAPVQRLADSICGPFVYAILGLSTATFLFWQGFGYTMFKDALVDYSYASMDSLAWLSSSTSVALRYAVNVLVVACPCALGLATPTSVLVGTSLAAKRGVLIRGGDVLESLAKVDTIIVDKTGTITEGWPSVVSTFSDTLSEKELLHLAASLESNASAKHPIARAIIDHSEALSAHLEDLEDDKITVEEVEYVTGKGVKGRCNGKMTAVGSLEWVLGSTGNDGIGAEEMGRKHKGSDHTLVYVGIEDSGIIGSMSLVDNIRADAKEVLERLQEDKGIKQVFMLSGDRQPVVNTVAKSVGIKAEHALGGLSPFEKSNFITDLQKKGHSVAMIGDGINDTLALSEARVGIAVTGGMDAASDAADIVLVDESRARRVFSQVEDAMGISQTTFSKIKQNLSWALMYNAFALPLATGALLPAFGLALEPALAGGMMAGSSLTVLLNSLSIYAIHPSASESNRK